MKRRTPVIHTYRGFANKTRIYLHGRVLKDKNIDYSDQTGLVRRLRNTYKRFESDELPYARVSASYGHYSWDLVADDEGYITLDSDLDLHTVDDSQQWFPVSLLLPDYPQIPPFKGEVMMPPREAQFGIITDIDDTILDTGTLNVYPWATLRNTFTRNHHQRIEVKGASLLLNALTRQGDHIGYRPVFYLSNSPWNLYNYLCGFIKNNGMPKGPVLLRDYGLHLLRRRPLEQKHKARSLRRIFQMYSDMQFILLGDGASHDAHHYASVAREFPGRVLAIYIRVTRHSHKVSKVRRVLLKNPEVYFKLVDDLAVIREDAREKGWVVDRPVKNR